MEYRSQLNPGIWHPSQSHSSKPNSFILTSVPNPESQSALAALKAGAWYQQRAEGLQLRTAGKRLTMELDQLPAARPAPQATDGTI